jgi:hypothetical protein
VAALSAQVLPAGGPSACTDWSAGTASGGIAAYTLNTQGTNHARIVMGSAAPPGGVDLAAGQEYFAFQLTLSHIKTVGTGACAGCLEPACVFLSAIDVIPGTNPSVLLSQGANYSGSRWVSWQMGYPINIQQGCSATGGGLFCLNPTTYFDVVPYSPTSTRGSTWGAVKALYR